MVSVDRLCGMALAMSEPDPVKNGGCPSKGIQSIEIGARLLDVLIETRQSMRLKELSERAGMSPSKARMYLVSLIRTGLIDQDAASGLYGPGPKALRLGIVALGQNGMLRSARELVTSLGREIGQPVLLTAWENRSPVIIAASEGTDDLPIAFRIGVQTPLWTTATGVVFLAFLPAATSQSLIEADCPPDERSTIEEEVARARKDGIVFRDMVRLGRHVTLGGYGAIAAPIIDRNDALEFVITVLVPTAGRKKPTAMMKLLGERTHALFRAQEGR